VDFGLDSVALLCHIDITRDCTGSVHLLPILKCLRSSWKNSVGILRLGHLD